MVRHFVSQSDLTADEVLDVLSRAIAIKPVRSSPEMQGKSLVMLFEKSSTRTRLSFEIGATQLGGHAINVEAGSSQLARGESIHDFSKVVSRYADIMMARVYAHATVAELAACADIPVINGLSDAEHPCQSMADILTILEYKGRLDGLRLAYVGDGKNNVTHSLMLAAAQVGIHMTVAAPESLRPEPQFVTVAREIANRHKGSLTLTEDPADAIRGADVVYTDVWVSMGQEADAVRRRDLLRPFQVNGDMVRDAADDFLFMHCLPAHIGEEVTADVAYGPHSVIFDQAENRLHVQKALMIFLLQSVTEGHK